MKRFSIVFFVLLVSVGCTDIPHGGKGPKLLLLDGEQNLACRGGVSVEQDIFRSDFSVRYRALTGPVEVRGVHKVEITDIPAGELAANQEKTGDADSDNRIAACYGQTVASSNQIQGLPPGAIVGPPLQTGGR